MSGEQVPDWGAIRVRGARENNLKDVSLDIPKRRLTAFTRRPRWRPGDLRRGTR